MGRRTNAVLGMRVLRILCGCRENVTLRGMPDTHTVTNQVPPLENYNPATSPVLVEALIREGGQWGLDEVTELGALSGSQQAQRWGELAWTGNVPVLRTHDKHGHRIDEVEYDPAYHELMRVAIGHGLHGAPWADDPPGAKSSARRRRRCGRRNLGTSARSR